MASNFPSAWAKFDHAATHFDSIERHIRKFLKGNPYPVSHKKYPNGGKHEFRVTRRREPDPAWGLIIGDCVHNLRSALDHVAWQAATNFGELDPDDTSTQFPIYRDREKFRDSGRRQMLRIGPKGQTLIKCVQPYRRPDPDRSVLWGIHALDVQDKHKVIPIMATLHKEGSIQADIPPGKEGALHVFGTVGPFEDGDILSTAELVPPDPKIKVKGEFSFHISLGEGSVLAGQEVLPALSKMRDATQRIIELFERFPDS